MSKEEVILTGMGVSKGVAEGVVKLVKDSKDSERFEEGDVLVTYITDPTMVAIMAKAAAIVCDIGGVTSHPSIVSREMGIPCVVATKNGTEVLSEGMRIEVNGETGEIKKLP